MISLRELSVFVVNALQATRLFHALIVVDEKSFSDEQFVVRVRMSIINGWNLQVHLYHNRGHYDYAYHVFENKLTIMRWDNKEDCPGLDNFPHHFHAPDGSIVASILSGDPVQDVAAILANLEKIIPAAP